MATVTPNFNWPVPTSTDLVKDGATAIEALGDSIDASLVDLKGGTTGQVLAKASGTDMDFAWVAQDDSNAIQNSIVDAKGDLIAATAADTPARLAVGTNGQVLTADSTAATGLAWATASSGSVNVAGKNGVLNSAMSVWQRATSFTISGFMYVADRWQAYRAVAGYTVSRQVTNDTTNLPFIQYGLRGQRDSGNTSTSDIYLAQSFETVNSIFYAGKTVTLSFYARAGANWSPTSGNLRARVFAGTGTDQNVLSTGYTGGSAPIDGNAALTTTWQRFTFSGAIPTNTTEVGLYYNAVPVGTAGANDWFEITGVQLEVAGSASAYSPNTSTYEAELAACQRYYFKDGKVVGQDGYAQNATTIYFKYYLQTTMRTTPTYTQTGGATFSSNTSATTFTVDANGSNEFSTNFYFLVGASNGYTYLYRPVEWSAEL